MTELQTTTIPLFMEIHFKHWVCTIHKAEYNNGRTALILRNLKDPGSVVAKCTVNLVEEKLERNEVIIKDYDENEDMYVSLLRAAVITPYKRIIDLGPHDGKCMVCDLLI